MGAKGTLRPHISADMSPATLSLELDLAVARIREITEAAAGKRRRVEEGHEVLGGSRGRVAGLLQKIEERGETYGWIGRR